MDILNRNVELVPIDTLYPHPANPRRGDVSAVIESIRANGFFGAVVAQTATRIVLAGNHRLIAARELGMLEIPVIWVDVDDEAAMRILLADNRTSDLATYDDDALLTLLDHLASTDTGLFGTGYTDADLDALLESVGAGQPGGEQDKPDDRVPDALDDLARPPGAWFLHRGDATEVAPTLPGLFDAVVCDPPYGLAFMGKGWDHSVPGPELWRAISAKLRPGAHVFAFGGTREFHHLALSLEQAGFEIRDCLMWLYGNGFPKSFDLGRAADRAAEAAEDDGRGRSKPGTGATDYKVPDGRPAGTTGAYAASTPEGRRLAGYATALKPAWEPIIVARKPLDGTLIQNVAEHGPGAFNIDGARIPIDAPITTSRKRSFGDGGAALGGGDGEHTEFENTQGRWPANVVLDEDAAAMLDAQSGETTSSDRVRHNRADAEALVRFTSAPDGVRESHGYSDAGGASRFFYTAKATRLEREFGLGDFAASKVYGEDGGAYDGLSNTRTERANIHPTVKPVDLIRWLAKLALVPPRHTESSVGDSKQKRGRKSAPEPRRVLVPFAGSGSEMLGCLLAGWEEVHGIEITPEYADIAEARIAAWCDAWRKLLTE